MKRAVTASLTQLISFELTENKVREILQIESDIPLTEKNWDSAIEKTIDNYIEDNSLYDVNDIEWESGEI
jgi:hypothetical protein